MAEMVPTSLLSRAAAGEVEAFERLLAPVIDSAYYAALGLLEDPAVAERAVAAACRRAFRQLRHRDADDAALRLWFVGIVRRECHRRQRWVRPRRPAADGDPGSTQQLRAAIGRLSFQERSLVVFHHYLGLSLEEVAQLEHVAPETARARLAQAAERLAPLMGDAGHRLDQEDLVFARRMQRLMNSLGGPSRKLRPRIDRTLRRRSPITRRHLTTAFTVALAACLVAATLPMVPAFARDAQKALDTFPILPGGGTISQSSPIHAGPVAQRSQAPPAPAGTTSGAATTGSSTGSHPTSNPAPSQTESSAPPPPLTIGDVSPPAAEVGLAYGPVNLSATGGSAPYHWAASGLPAGLSIDPNLGRIQGTPGAAFAGQATVTVTDAHGGTQTKNLTLNVAAAVGIGAVPPQGELGAGYGAMYSPTGGVAPFTWTCTACPSGLTVSIGGAVTGMPTSSPASVTVKVTDALGGTVARTDTIPVAPQLQLAGGALTAVHGLPYSNQLAATGGVPTFTYAVTLGALPAGLTLTASGLLSGTPASAATSTFTVTVSDACPGCLGGHAIAAAIFTMTVT